MNGESRDGDGATLVVAVEDDPKMARLLERAFDTHGFRSRIFTTGESLLIDPAVEEADAIVIDVGLPDINGFVLCRMLRDRRLATPVLMLTARDSVEDRVTGLDSGADDYLVKPFALEELFARLRALRRRGDALRSAVLEGAGLRLDPVTHQVWRGGEEIHLSPREFGLLETFLRHPGIALSRSQLAEHVWGYEPIGESNIVDVYVRYLRNKIDRPFGTNSIVSVRGVGYRLAP